jgi:hypothetical protein
VNRVQGPKGTSTRESLGGNHMRGVPPKGGYVAEEGNTLERKKSQESNGICVRLTTVRIVTDSRREEGPEVGSPGLS